MQGPRPALSQRNTGIDTDPQRPQFERAVRAGSRSTFKIHYFLDPGFDVVGPRPEVGKCLNRPGHLFVTARSTATILKHIHIQISITTRSWLQAPAKHWIFGKGNAPIDQTNRITNHQNYFRRQRLRLTSARSIVVEIRNNAVTFKSIGSKIRFIGAGSFLEPQRILSEPLRERKRTLWWTFVPANAKRDHSCVTCTCLFTNYKIETGIYKPGIKLSYLEEKIFDFTHDRCRFLGFDAEYFFRCFDFGCTFHVTSFFSDKVAGRPLLISKCHRCALGIPFFYLLELRCIKTQCK